MTVNNTMGAAELLRKYLESPAGSDLLGEMVKMAAELLMDADVDVLCNAGYGERSDDRVNSRNGHRERRWDTRAGTISLDVPKLRQGSYLPGLLEPRRRVEQALVSVDLPGLCRRRLHETRRRPRELDGDRRDVQVPGLRAREAPRRKVAEFRNRPLDAGPYAYVWLDALFHKVREGGRVVSVATVVATGVNADGHREILGVDVISAEDGAGWTAFLRGLVARGLSGVALVVSDAHEGLKNAIAAVLDRCVLAAVPDPCHAQPAHPSTEGRPGDGRHPRADDLRPARRHPGAKHSSTGSSTSSRPSSPRPPSSSSTPRQTCLAFSSFPSEHWTQIWSNNPQERLNKELRRRTDVVGHLPEPGRVHPPRRSGPRRAARRVGRRPALHEP